MRFDLRDERAVVVDIVDGRPATEHRSGGVLDPEVAAAVGASLGAWHAGAAAHAARFRVAPGTPPQVASVRDPLLAAALVAASSEWRPTTVIHGDCRMATAVVTAEPTGCGGASVVLTGWARSGVGDPAWDLGSLVADLLASAHAAGRAAVAEASTSAALAAYARASGPSGLARRVALCTVAQLVDRGLGDGHRGSFELARSIAAWLPNWTARFERWLA
jgi:hypothetical protein